MSLPPAPPPPSRTPLGDPSWAGRRKAFGIPIAVSAAIFLLVTLANMTYLFGSTFNARSRRHALNVLAVDYDGSVIGQALAAAYSDLKADTFPTLTFRPVVEFAQPALVKQAVCRADYWAAIYTHPGATSRLSATLDSNHTAMAPYDAHDTVTIVYNSARWPIVGEQLRGNLERLVAASRGSYYRSNNGSAALATLTGRALPQAAAAAAYLDPLHPADDIILPTLQGSSGSLTTVNFVFPPLLQLFLVLALNGVLDALQVHARARIRDVWLLRSAVGMVYSCLCALVVAGYTFAFREDWGVDVAAAFFQTWALFWLHLEVNWLLFDALVGSYVSMRFVSPFVFTWLVINLASTSWPLELMPRWYRVSYALPARQTWVLLVRAWSGCGGETRVALLVLFTWWVAGLAASGLGVRKRCLEAGARAAKAAGGGIQSAMASSSTVGGK
ncbi:protein of unknown function DUF3533 [Macrophomina phaseolina MS6]|uniref:DUF3533 domain-containing protein n=1 Tax=Macrophomina phaseolina (strain MS6) TaxID=1126212 RepID=K2R9W1_MACPH|nr:protein of unknown function DUF3533 [Macrophomina phaseolina MS6]